MDHTLLLFTMAESSLTSTASNAATTGTIQLDTLSLEQLDQLKQREENRLHMLTQRFATLRQAAARLSASSSAVSVLFINDTITDGDKTMSKKEVFVPLTESVYIPGTIVVPSSSNTDGTDDAADASAALLVELGTGYFVETSAEQTVQFLGRKLDIVNANSENGTTPQLVQVSSIVNETALFMLSSSSFGS
jgi:prefoldin alpha subunit